MDLDPAQRPHRRPDAAARRFDIGIDSGPHRRHRAAARRRRPRDRSRRPPGLARLHRDPHPPRQVGHSRPLQGREGRPGGSDRRGRARPRRQFTPEDVYTRAKRTLEKMHPQRHHAHAHPARGRSRHRPARARRRAAADRRIQVGDRHRDLHLPAGRAAQQSGHRRADGRGAQARRQGGRRGALYRHQSQGADGPRVRDGARVRHRHRHASRFRAERRRPRPDVRLRAGREVQIRRPRRHRPRDQAFGGARRSSSRRRRSAWPTPAWRSPCCLRPIST